MQTEREIMNPYACKSTTKNSEKAAIRSFFYENLEIIPLDTTGKIILRIFAWSIQKNDVSLHSQTKTIECLC